MTSQSETNPSTDVIDQHAIISVIEKVAGQTKQNLFTRQDTLLIWKALLRLYFDQYPVEPTQGELSGAAEQRITDGLLKKLDMEMSEPVQLA